MSDESAWWGRLESFLATVGASTPEDHKWVQEARWLMDNRPEPDDREGLVCIPRDMARLAADGLEVRVDDLSDAGSNAYGAGDEERGERLQQWGRDYRRVVRTLRDRLQAQEAGDGG